MIQHILIGLADRVSHQFVTYHATVNEKMLHICLAAGKCRQSYPTGQFQAYCCMLKTQRVLDEGFAQQLGQTMLLLSQAICCTGIEHIPAIVSEPETHIKTSQCQASQHLLYMSEFGLIGLQKLAPRWCIVKKIQHFNRGSGRMRRRLGCICLAFYLPRMV